MVTLFNSLLNFKIGNSISKHKKKKINIVESKQEVTPIINILKDVSVLGYPNYYPKELTVELLQL